MRDVTVTTVNPDSLWSAIGLEVNLPAFARAGIVGEEIRACWGLAWVDCRCMAWFARFGEFPEDFFPIMMTEIKRTFRAARQLGETVIYTTRDKSYETSEQFLRAMKFQPTGEEWNGEELWMRPL